MLGPLILNGARAADVVVRWTVLVVVLGAAAVATTTRPGVVAVVGAEGPVPAGPLLICSRTALTMPFPTGGPAGPGDGAVNAATRARARSRSCCNAAACDNARPRAAAAALWA